MFNSWQPKTAPLTSSLPFWSGSTQTDDAVQDPPQYDFGLRPDTGTIDQYPLLHAECKFRLVDVYLSYASSLRQQLEHPFNFMVEPASNIPLSQGQTKDQPCRTSFRSLRMRLCIPLRLTLAIASSKALSKRKTRRRMNSAQQWRAGTKQHYYSNKTSRVITLLHNLRLKSNYLSVFKLSLGNVMPDQTATVQISFVSLVSYEGAPDTLRLTFPAYIAPRYGTRPADVPASGSAPFSSLDFACSVDVGSNITTISSPSHPITSQLGSLGTDSANDNQFDPRKAFITLSSSTFLEKDIVLIINYKDMDRPRCIAESYPSEDGKSDTTAYALTLVPKFKIPPLSKQEYIFLVDRSGSMAGGKINAVRSALQVPPASKSTHPFR
jgi:hypothetical protein